MVSFSCEVCNDTIVKKKLMQHRSTCAGAHFTCLDCQTTFQGLDFQKHTSCISEAEKYQKGLYKAPSKKQKTAVNVTEQKKEEKVPESTEIQLVTPLERKENAKDGDKKETKLPTKDKKNKKDKKAKKKEATKKESTDVTTERKEDKADLSPEVNDKADDKRMETTFGEDSTSGSPSESKVLEMKADTKSKKENNKRKLDETTEAKAESSDSKSDPDSDDDAPTTGTPPKDKKAKVEKPAEAANTNGVANGKRKTEIPSDVVQSQIQSMVARGGGVSFKSLIKHLRRNKETHVITKAELMRRLVLKAEGDKLILSIAT
ncbi:hypothetical protein V1508DRAFT_454504 [Lipomyces doorenjongii]|uniref:uncharacterized protein n=1 Tax=Lipomyces doorenjongii TaxID=383834 RepID=UPI0034CE4DFB